MEFLILGGGPAGAAAGRLLALLGHRVRLVARPDPARAPLAESLTPSTRKLFDALSLSGAIDAAGFVRSTGNTVWWAADDADLTATNRRAGAQGFAGPGPRVERFADGARGWQVEVGALEKVLLRQAELAGAIVECRAASAADLEHPFVLDCTGRAGLLARVRHLRHYEEGLRGVALGGNWRRDGAWPLPDESHTVVEAYADGWAFSLPLAGGDRQIAVMVDAERSALARGASARQVYLAELAKTHVCARLVRNARLVGGPWGWDATAYHAEAYAGTGMDLEARGRRPAGAAVPPETFGWAPGWPGGWLLVGDAGSIINPLSSSGVKKALASGWLAAIVANTCARHPGRAGAALGFFDAREREVVAAYRALTRRYLSEAGAGRASAFWVEHTGEAARADSEALLDGERDVPSAAVRTAFEHLRQAPNLAVRRGPAFVVEPRPAVSGFEIVLEPRIVGRDDPRGVRYVADVDMVTLVELAPQASEVPELFERYCRASAPVALPDFLRALATAVARGWLVAQ